MPPKVELKNLIFINQRYANLIMKYIILSFFILSVAYSSYSQNTKTGKDEREKLFQMKGNISSFVLTVADTAYCESIRADKIPYFTGQDTLIRSKSDHLFYSKKRKMVLEDSIITITMKVSKKDQEKSFTFLPANDKQIIEWNKTKNRYNYYQMNDNVNKTIYQKSYDPNSRKTVETEWKAISKYIWTLNRDEFDSLLTTFKKKYSIK